MKLVLSSNQLLYETVASIVLGRDVRSDFHFFRVWQPDDVERRRVGIAHFHDHGVLARRCGDVASWDANESEALMVDRATAPVQAQASDMIRHERLRDARSTEVGREFIDRKAFERSVQSVHCRKHQWYLMGARCSI